MLYYCRQPPVALHACAGQSGAQLLCKERAVALQRKREREREREGRVSAAAQGRAGGHTCFCSFSSCEAPTGGGETQSAVSFSCFTKTVALQKQLLFKNSCFPKTVALQRQLLYKDSCFTKTVALQKYPESSLSNQFNRTERLRAPRRSSSGDISLCSGRDCDRSDFTQSRPLQGDISPERYALLGANAV